MLEQQTKSLYQQLIQAREDERKYIARELHDQIIQALVGLSYHLSNMRAQPGSDVDERLAQVQADLRRILDDVRRICADLRPAALKNLGLVAAVRSYIREVRAKSTFHISLQIEEASDQPLPEDTTLCLFRVLQETLANIQKHAAASEVVVRLLLYPDKSTLTVWDNGQGFCVPSPLDRLLVGQHFGLVGMRERLELAQGSLAVSSTPGHGTCVHASVPCRLSLDQ